MSVAHAKLESGSLKVTAEVPDGGGGAGAGAGEEEESLAQGGTRQNKRGVASSSSSDVDAVEGQN